jgi:phenylalanyl-tRNA synthetase beta chain
MRVPLSWLREYAAIGTAVNGREVAEKLTSVGFEVESLETYGGEVSGPLVVGLVREVEILEGFKKPIRFCQVEVGPAHGGVRGIVCGASNFVVGDLVVAALPGAVLPGGFAIASRETYGHISDGMICSERELGLGDDHSGIMVLPAGTAEPGAEARPILSLGDEILDISVLADSGYAMSIRGIAREVANAFGVVFTDPADIDSDVAGSGGDVTAAIIEDPTAASVLILRTLDGFNPTAVSPEWMNRRLAMAGMRPVSLAVDVTNYVMLEIGQPLHAFDRAQLHGAVRVRRATPGETLETLDHVQRELFPEDVLIADDSGPLSVAGIMGGLHSEVADNTSALVIEAAHFDAVAIARQGRRHKLSSEASRRFERGVDYALPRAASARAVDLLTELGGGHYVGSSEVLLPTEPTVVAMAADLPGRTAGVPIDVAEVLDRLRAVGCTVLADGDLLSVTTPSWRPDLTDPADLVEEVLRQRGYDSIPSTLPHATVGRGRTREQRLRRRADLAASAAGFVEVINYPFLGATEFDSLGLAADDTRRHALILANPLSDEAPLLRTTLLPGLLGALRRNVSRGTTDVALFETGSVFQPHPDQPARGITNPPRPSVAHRPSDAELAELDALLPAEPRYLSAVATGRSGPSSWFGEGRPVDWTDVVELARAVASEVGTALEVRQGQRSPWHPGRTAELVVHGVVVGHAGELHPKVLETLGLPARTVALELNLDAVLAAAVDVVPAPDVRTYPVAKEDVALVVDVTVPVATVEHALRSGASDLLESVRLFDVYTGSQVGEGKKSLAFSLRFRAADRTLSADEVAAERAAALAAAALVGATLRV